MINIYLDSCCLNRPFDEQNQYRIRIESEAVLFILAQVKMKQLEFVSSEVLNIEIDQIPDLKRRTRVKLLTTYANRLVRIEQKEIKRAKHLESLGFCPFDALHIACAESGHVDVFLTTDDKLFRLANRVSNQLTIQVSNPIKWLEEVTKK
jgi:predicted nucleic acid-binding protein